LESNFIVQPESDPLRLGQPRFVEIGQFLTSMKQWKVSIHKQERYLLFDEYAEPKFHLRRLN